MYRTPKLEKTMNRLSSALFALGLMMVTLISKVHGQCDILPINSSQVVCANTQTTFYLDCGAAISVNWYVNSVNVGAGFSLNYTFPSAGQYTVIASYSTSSGGGGGGIPLIDDPGGSGGSATLIAQVVSTPQSPQIIVNGGTDTFCDIGSVNLIVTNPITEQAYNWRSVPAGFLASSANASFSNIAQTTDFIVSTSFGGCTSESRQTISVIKTSLQPIADPRVLYHKKILKPSGQTYDIHYWQSSSTGTLRTQPNQAVSGQGYEVTEQGDYFIRAYSYGGNCWSAATGPLQVQLNYTPPVAEIAQAQSPGYTEVYLTNGDNAHIMRYADYYWVSDATTTATIVKQYSSGTNLLGSKIFENGNYYLRGKDRGTGTWGSTLPINIQLGDFDKSLNWVFTRSFDGTKDGLGNLNIISESKSYFDERGQALQSQTKTFHNNQPHVFASQSLKDKYDRTVGGTLSAPILQNDFRYSEGFALNIDGKPLTYTDFDKAVPLSTDQKGSLGNYYSVQNQWNEKDVPNAKRLFSRTDFYEDGTGEERKSAQPGDTHFIGSGREVLKGTFPVGNSDVVNERNELTDYLEKRAIVFGGAALKKIEGVQTVVRDENEKFVVSISDKSGKVLMTARKGTKPFASSVSSDKMAYFYVLAPPNVTTQNITIDGTSSYTIENTITNTTITKLTSALPHTYTLAAGFYRVLPSTGTVKVSYTNYFSDIAYQFYNDAGRLVVSVSPNGYEQWISGTTYADIDKSTHTYNHQGWLLSMTEKDAGTTNYLYRRDGKIRFSQNAEQLLTKKYSYTNYDDLGRPIESGESTYLTTSFNDLKTNLEAKGSDWMGTSPVKKDWVQTGYDFPVAGPDFSLVPGFVQTYVRGAVSYTKNANTKTWYSYDELGRVVWMAQQPTAFPYAFVTQYDYDFLGNVLTTSTKAYSGSTSRDAFYHHYEYDRNKRLQKVYTSLDGTKKTLQAEYIYYLHGPLKRVVLATNLQGIDFVYNIHGWLTQINHPDDAKSDDANLTKDPGKDSPNLNGVRKDVFGMILEYYERSMTPIANSLDPKSFHKLPVVGEEGQQRVAAIQSDPITLYKTMLRSSMETLRNKSYEVETKPSGSGGQ
jgi:hypothetical protein